MVGTGFPLGVAEAPPRLHTRILGHKYTITTFSKNTTLTKGKCHPRRAKHVILDRTKHNSITLYLGPAFRPPLE